VNGKEECHPEGAYYLDWRRNGVRIRLSVGKNAQDALTQRDRKTFELNAANHGVELASSIGPNGSAPNDGHKLLSVAVADFLEDTKLSKKPKTLAAYKTALNYFTESCPKLGKSFEGNSSTSSRSKSKCLQKKAAMASPRRSCENTMIEGRRSTSCMTHLTT
jgi:hypothetical protein